MDSCKHCQQSLVGENPEQTGLDNAVDKSQRQMLSPPQRISKALVCLFESKPRAQTQQIAAAINFTVSALLLMPKCWLCPPPAHPASTFLHLGFCRPRSSSPLPRSPTVSWLFCRCTAPDQASSFCIWSGIYLSMCSVPRFTWPFHPLQNHPPKWNETFL